MHREQRAGSSPDRIPKLVMDESDLVTSSAELHVAVALHKERKRIIDRVVTESSEHGNSWLPIERIKKIIAGIE